MTFTRSHILFSFLFVLGTSLACKNTKSQITIVEPASIESKHHEPLTVPIDSSAAVYNGLARKASVMRYYKRFGTSPIWIRNNEFTPLADSMRHVIANVQYYGFPTGRYHLNELAVTVSNLSREALIRNELLMTDAFLWLATEVQFGFQRSRTTAINDSSQIVRLHHATINGGLVRVLESQEPAASGYRSLKQALRMVIDSIRSADDSISMTRNIRLISINLERWRADTCKLGQRYLLINIPSYMLELVKDDSIVLSSKVIVGTPDKETPVLSSKIECISIYPYWHVPRKIAIEEYLPIIKKDIAFISRSNFDVLDKKGNVLNPDSVEWNNFNNNYFPVVLRQREGPENSLGSVKFIFDNPYAVFLHDTNAKYLFKIKARAFSHGCVRMEKAVELAHFLVMGKVGRESKYVSKFLKEKTQHWVDLKNPIPIHIRYFTCELRNNILLSYEDIYEKDNMLYKLLFADTHDLDL